LDWGVRFTGQRNHPARAFHAADRGDVRATPVLLETANNQANSALLRASAISHLSALNPARTTSYLGLWLSSSDPLIRQAAAEAVGHLPPEQRLPILTPVLEDPVLGVRMTTAEQLADLPVANLSTQAERVAALNSEYREVQSQHLDMPSVLAQLSRFQLAQGEAKAAEAGLLSALKKNPQSSVARVNLADLYRSLGDDSAARVILETGLTLSADDGAMWFSKGLLEIRDGNPEAGLKALETAAALEETPGYYHYVFAVAQNDQGYPQEALDTLEELHRLAPGQPNVLSALMQYSNIAGDRPAAERYREELRTTLKAAGLQ
jgi:Tfp pilus assembly protein PilF